MCAPARVKRCCIPIRQPPLMGCRWPVPCCALLCCAPCRFVKLCKAAAKGRDGVEDASPIVFLKHNVYDDEEEEVTDLAKKYNVRVSHQKCEGVGLWCQGGRENVADLAKRCTVGWCLCGCFWNRVFALLCAECHGVLCCVSAQHVSCLLVPPKHQQPSLLSVGTPCTGPSACCCHPAPPLPPSPECPSLHFLQGRAGS